MAGQSNPGNVLGSKIRLHINSEEGTSVQVAYSLGMYTHTHTHTYRLYVEIKCQLDATEVFIADLTARSTRFGHHYAHHQELKSNIQWLLPVVFKLLVWCGAEGYVSDLQDAAASCKPDT